MFSAEKGHASVVQLLLKNGANPMQKDKMSKIALDFSANDPNNPCNLILINNHHTGK